MGTHPPLVGGPDQACVPRTAATRAQPHLIDINLVLLHVVPVIDLAAIHKLHQKNPLGGQLPVDAGDLEWERAGQKGWRPRS